MTSNHKLTGVLQGRTINGTSNSGDTLTIHFTDGSQMTVQTTGSSNSASSGGTIKGVRQQGTTLALDFEAGGTRGVPFMSGDDTTFANDFGSGNLFGAFLGWNGDAAVYGDQRAPSDDWAFWRNDLWVQFTNVNQTYAKDWANLNRDYTNKPPSAITW